MRKPSEGRDLGDKLGPRLADLAAHAVIAARRGLAPHEARVQAAALQTIIDRAGHEVADLYRPLLGDLLSRDSVDPVLREHIAKASSGVHQWQALAGFAFGASGGASALSTIISNEIAPLVYGVVRDNPHLIPDVGTVAGLLARNVISEGDAVSAGGATGYHRGWTLQMADAQAAVPDVTTLAGLVNRGIITWEDAVYWLGRAAVPGQLRAALMDLRRQLLTPADAALAVLRGEIPQSEGATIASWSGMWGSDFNVLVANSGEPLGLEQLLEAYRRGFIDQARLVRGIRQSRVRDEWTDVAQALRFSPVPTADAVDAWLRGHLGHDAAVRIATQNGVEPGQVQILLDNAGNPPAPEQLLELWRRGAINEDTARRGLVQGRTRPDWVGQVLELRDSPMSTADAIDAWQRGHITQAEAVKVTRENGVLARDIPALLANAGNPLALEQLLEAYRRGIITTHQVENGIRQGRLRDDWIPAALALRWSPMSTADAVAASVQGYLTKEAAQRIAEENGLRAQDFGPLWDTAGEPLARTELQQLYNRRVITLATYRQAMRESRLKDKYIDAAIQLHTRLPEPRQVTAAIADGVITAAQGAALLAEDGYSPAVIAMLVKTGAIRSTGPYRQLLTAEIATLYADRMITRAEAERMLTVQHYQPEVQALILDLADHKRDQKIRDSAIAAIRAHYLAGRTTKTDAAADLLALDITHDTVRLYLQVWGIERLANPRQLTEAQIVKATNKGLFVEQGHLTDEQWHEKNHKEGHDRLVRYGYSPDDADLLLAGA